MQPYVSPHWLLTTLLLRLVTGVFACMVWLGEHRLQMLGQPDG